MHAVQLGERVDVEVRRVFRQHSPVPADTLLRLSHVVDACWETAKVNYPCHALIQARVVHHAQHGMLLALPDDTTAWLPDSELTDWPPPPDAAASNGTRPSKDQWLTLRITGHDSAYKRLKVSQRQVDAPLPAPAHLTALTDVLLQGRLVNLGNKGTLFAFDNGLTGWLPDKELCWSADHGSARAQLQLGQRLTLRIKGVHPKKGNLHLSLREAHPHPLDARPLHHWLNTQHRCFVTSVLDFGVFVHLPQLGLDALLHQSNMPAGLQLSKGETLEVCIDSVDTARRRVGVRHLTTLAQRTELLAA